MMTIRDGHHDHTRHTYGYCIDGSQPCLYHKWDLITETVFGRWHKHYHINPYKIQLYTGNIW